MAAASSKVDVDANYETQVRNLAELAAAEGSAFVNAAPGVWARPKNWSGSLNDWEGLDAVFATPQADEGAALAVSDPNAPGTVGDMIAAATMSEYLSVMERAFRARHTSRIRSLMHAAGRKIGQGNPGGTFIKLGLEYVRGLVAGSRAK